MFFVCSTLKTPYSFPQNKWNESSQNCLNLSIKTGSKKCSNFIVGNIYLTLMDFWCEILFPRRCFFSTWCCCKIIKQHTSNTYFNIQVFFCLKFWLFLEVQEKRSFILILTPCFLLCILCTIDTACGDLLFKFIHLFKCWYKSLCEMYYPLTKGVIM